MTKGILLVEDDADAREIISAELRDRGYQVLIATNGAEGVHMARRHQPHLILMDIRMPVMDGWHAITYLRSDPRTKQLPVWGISGYFDSAESPVGGFHRLIDKPIDPRNLLEKVEAFLGPPEDP